MTAVDLFAGAGGFSTGARMAGIRVVWAGNHWSVACKIHATNHPETEHSCQDLHQADWSTVPTHDILLASPACQGHSRARGIDRPHHDSARSTAWAVVSCAEAHRPPVMVVENVPEFLRWPLFPAWSDALRLLGYSLSPQIIDAADHGVPQHRVRLYLVATRSAHPLTLPRIQRPHVPVASILEDLPARSRVVDRCPRTRDRIRVGRAELGPKFLVSYYGSTRGGRSLDRPLGTVTTRARYALVDGPRMRMLTVTEYRRAMGFPDDYQLPPQGAIATHLLGNAVCPPVARDLIAEIIRRI